MPKKNGKKPGIDEYGKVVEEFTINIK